ncbi:hypothetical protein HanXRQr2_Chr05g0218251 [Helianthus annuus]|uniref:Uncharacterized protein n=1 Tax=Helianthus annuus TaxID=4232 RepID=A0A9K3J0P3_HELAN|nr:hypothetical protein HanXRQr2_Chr05g0218251 [Helianthus annuus]
MPHLCVLNQTLLHRSLPPNRNPTISRFSDGALIAASTVSFSVNSTISGFPTVRSPTT